MLASAIAGAEKLSADTTRAAVKPGRDEIGSYLEFGAPLMK